VFVADHVEDGKHRRNPAVFRAQVANDIIEGPARER
jgi:hypothetical protein